MKMVSELNDHEHVDGQFLVGSVSKGVNATGGSYFSVELRDASGTITAKKWDATLEDEKKDATVETVKDIIAADGVVGEVDVWGLRKLAYPIQKLAEGYYVVINFEGNPTLPKELDRRLRISDNVMRHIIVAKDEK